MKYAVFLHVFTDISVNVYVFLQFFLGISAMNSKYLEIYYYSYMALINITNYKCVMIWNHFPKFGHIMVSLLLTL